MEQLRRGPRRSRPPGTEGTSAPGREEEACSRAHRARTCSRPGSSASRPVRVRQRTRPPGGRSRSAARGVRARGGRPVVFVHGMFGASFTYRQLLQLALPASAPIALGLRVRLRRPAGETRLELQASAGQRRRRRRSASDRFHLVVHDVGGVGFELAAAPTAQVLSLTLLNTVVDVSESRPPWSCAPSGCRSSANYGRAISRRAVRSLEHRQGIGRYHPGQRRELTPSWS